MFPIYVLEYWLNIYLLQIFNNIKNSIYCNVILKLFYRGCDIFIDLEYHNSYNFLITLSFFKIKLATGNIWFSIFLDFIILKFKGFMILAQHKT